MPQAAGLYYSLLAGGHPDHPPVILIHGAGSHHLCWPVEIRRLKGYRVLALDLPGHGRSEEAGQQTISAYSQKVLDFMEAVGIYQAVLVGHAMGGAIALMMAKMHPERVLGIGVISSGAYLKVPKELLEDLASPFTLPLALKLLQDRLFGADVTTAVSKLVMQTLKETRPGVLYGDWQACERFDLRSEVEKIATPAWVAMGMQDRLVSPACALFLASQMPKAQLQWIPPAGHMVILEKPQELCQRLRKFLLELYPNESNLWRSRIESGIKPNRIIF